MLFLLGTMTRAYLRVEFCTRRGVNDRTVRAAIVVTADQLLVRDSEHASHIRFSCETEFVNDFVEGSGLFSADCEIDHGDVGSENVNLALWY